MTNGAELGFMLHPNIQHLVNALLSRLDVHLFIEGVFVAVICYLLFQKSYKPRGKNADALTEKVWDAHDLNTRTNSQ
jgi:hypothetical protein